MTCRPPEFSASEPEEQKPEERINNFSEVLLAFSSQQAQQAASRCLATIECTYCHVCQMICPDQCITRDSHTGYIQIALEHCKGCGLCAHMCPKGAIEMEVEQG
jgi:Pyruvate/2-oxoacid:ferredoxin oxidoreductase delta subunit